MKKIGRNDPCPCGSGKKFKKCCESTMIGGRFKASKINIESAIPVQKSIGLTSFFQSHVAKPIQKAEHHKPIHVTKPPESSPKKDVSSTNSEGNS